MSDILTNTRALLTSFEAVAEFVGDRIRPHRPDSDDDNLDLIILDLPDADQFNCLSGEGIVNGDLIIRTRSTDKSTAAAIAEAVRSNSDGGLDGYDGSAGDGRFIQCERIEFSEYEVDDEDDDNDGWFETETLYSVWYQTT